MVLFVFCFLKKQMFSDYLMSPAGSGFSLSLCGACKADGLPLCGTEIIYRGIGLSPMLGTGKLLSLENFQPLLENHPPSLNFRETEKALPLDTGIETKT